METRRTVSTAVIALTALAVLAASDAQTTSASARITTTGSSASRARSASVQRFHTSTARTIAVVRGGIGALAQSKGRLAWIRLTRTCPHAEILDLRTHRLVRVSSPRTYCEDLQFVNTSLLAFDGKRVLWQSEGWGNTEVSVDVLTAALGDRHTRSIGGTTFSCPDNGCGSWVGPGPALAMVAAPSVLIFHQPCSYGSCDGDVRRVVGHKSRSLFEGWADGLALAGRRLAVLRNRVGCCNVGPQWSPDGRKLAWTHWGRGSSLVVANADGTQPTVVAVNGEDPVWRSDGTRLAFTDYADGENPKIDIVGADGSEARTLAAGQDPEWSPDGTRLAFVRANDLYRIDADGSHETRLTGDAGTSQYVEPRWSPDGTRLVAERGSRVYVVDAVAAGDSVLPPPEAYGPAWSPDGTRIAFAAGDGEHSRVGVMNADGSDEHLLTSGRYDRGPVWSKDGGRLAFSSGAASDSPSEVDVVNADGSGRRTLSRGKTSAAGPAWAPGGAAIAWGDGWPNPGGGIVVAAADGGNQVRIAGWDETEVGLRDASTGALAWSRLIPATPDAIAVSTTHLVIASYDHESRLQLHRFRVDGTLLGQTRLKGPISDLSMVGHWAVYAKGRFIFGLDAKSGKAKIVAAPARGFWGVSTFGRRLIWAEHAGRDRTRIKSMVLR